MQKFLNVILFLSIIFISSTAFGEKLTNSISKKDLHEIIKTYLIENPEVVERALLSLKEKRDKEKDRLVSKKIKSKSKEIFYDSRSPVSGNPDGKIVIAEYFDYRCGYCRASYSILKKILKENKEVKVVHKELPILGKLSLLASKAALAAHLQGKYKTLHAKLMEKKFQDLEQIFLLAKESGLNIELLKKDMNSQKIQDTIFKTRKLAIFIGVRSTPTYIIGNKIYPGALNVEQLKTIISKSSKK
ncbi:MAG: DsbA family protein [bacterium]